MNAPVRSQADLAFYTRLVPVKMRVGAVADTTRPRRPDEVRGKETICTRTHRNGAKQTGQGIEKTGANRSRAKRYRGSNPCLPANINRAQTVTYTNKRKMPKGPRRRVGPRFQ